MSREMKDSGVKWIGEIPEEFDVREVKNIFNIGRGRVIAKTEIEPLNNGALYPVYSSQTVNNGCMGYIHTYDYEQDGLTWTTDGANAGTVFLRTGKFNCTNVCGILTTKDKNKFYLPYFAYSVNLSAINSRRSDILGHKVMSNEMAHFKVTYPTDYNEQIQIANFLDRKCTAIDTAIEKTKKSIEKLEEYKKAVITKAVTKGIDSNVKMKDSGVEWIGEIPEGWKVTKTKYLFRILKRIAGREGFDVISITQKGLKIKDITSNEGQVAENYSNYQFVFPGDFAMNHMDLLTGWVDLSAFTGVTSPDYRVFHKINESVNDDYYKYVFQSLYFNKVYYGLAQGVAEVGRKRLRAPAFKELKLPCPPADEQAKIAAYIKNKCMAIDALIEKKQTAINKWEEYKKSLIYYAVTGKIDLVEMR